MKKINWKDPKTKAVAAGAAGIVAFALYRSKHPSSPAASAIQPGGTDPTGAASALGDANLQSAVYDSLEGQLTGLAGLLSADQVTLGAQDQKLTSLSALLAKTTKAVGVLQHKPSSPAPKPVPKPGPAKKVPVVKTKLTPKLNPNPKAKVAPTALQNQEAALRYIAQTQQDRQAALQYIGATKAKPPAKKK